ncbi:hypothetical protein [Arthrobacter humicola]
MIFTTLVSKFAVSTVLLGNYRAFSSELRLAINKLENTVPVAMLRDGPLDDPVPLPEPERDEVPSLAQRTNFAIQELRKWREEQTKLQETQPGDA